MRLLRKALQESERAHVPRSHSTHPNTPNLPLAALHLLGVAMPAPGQHQPVAGGIMGESGMGIV